MSDAIEARRVEREYLADRVELHRAGALDVVDLNLPLDRNLCFLTAFVLQEVLQQRGAEAIKDMLATTVRRYPDAHWLVIEVDHRAEDPTVMRHGLGLAYYNPYYLLHELTEQRLERREFWEQLFHDAGLEIVEIAHPDHGVDSTDLELSSPRRGVVRCRRSGCGAGGVFQLGCAARDVMTGTAGGGSRCG